VQLSLIVLFIVLFSLIILSAFFSGSEIGMMSLNRYRLRHLVKKSNKKAIRVNQMLARPDRLLSVILIGSTVANIVASMVATLIGQRLYGDAGVAVAAFLLTFVILVFSEMVPKTVAAIHPQKVAFFSSFPLKILQGILAPIVQILSWITSVILKLFNISVEAQREALSGEELRSVVHEAGGLLPLEHKSMLISLLDLERATVEDIMIPKVDIIGLDLEQPWHKLLEELEMAQHTRLPLYRHSIDNLVGLVHVRHILNLAMEERLDLENLLKVVDPPYFIPEATPLNVQISNFQKMKKRSCFVVDEYGDLLGLVTLEDILEEVVGEFTTDISDLSKDVIQQNDGSVLVDASITLRQLHRLLGWHFPLIGPKTLSGLIIEQLGYIPPSDCCLQIGNVNIEILKVAENMIKTVKMWEAK
jgi:Mg2+/Co2+ transporter CorB